MVPGLKHFLRRLLGSVSELVPHVVVAYHGFVWLEVVNFFDRTPNYSAMGAIMREDAWGVLFLSLGMIGAGAVLLGAPLRVRRVLLYFPIGAMTFLGASFFLSNLLSLNAATSAAVATLSWSVANRLGSAIVAQGRAI